MGMKCSFEIPTAHAKVLRSHQDYDFTLAHMWLRSEPYRAAYDYGSVMDNGMYELGTPLELADLKRAVSLARPTVAIAPDYSGDTQRTFAAWRDASSLFDCEVAGVLQGSSVAELVDLFKRYRDQACEIICYPFRTPRIEVLKTLAAQGELDKSHEIWHHFLGLHSMSELQALKAFHLIHTSIDTSKPIKAAIHNKDIHSDLKGLGRIDLEATYDVETVDRMVFNANRFREIAQE